MYNTRNPVKNILVISPHADDEVIGCGGVISLASKAGINVTVIVMAAGGIKHCHLDEISSTETRVSEFKECSQRLGVSSSKVLFPGKDMRLETIPCLELVTAIDNVLNETEYDECYIPEPSYNIDHRITYESAMAALRPCAGRYPGMVATYESTISGWMSKSKPFGRLYIDISSTFENKLFAFEAYQSQIRSFPHPVSKEGIRKLADLRGMECGVEHAELFQIIRMIVV